MQHLDPNEFQAKESRTSKTKKKTCTGFKQGYSTQLSRDLGFPSPLVFIVLDVFTDSHYSLPSCFLISLSCTSTIPPSLPAMHLKVTLQNRSQHTGALAQ